MFDISLMMDHYQLVLVAAVGGYLSGSIPYGLILCAIGGHGDIRKIGSKNIGATNVLRTGNKWLALATLALDIAKGAVPVAIAMQFGAEEGLWPSLALITAICAVLGHMFPPWLKFKGGKGVATGIGALLGLNWMIALSVAAVWLVMAFLGRISSLSALIAFIMAPLIGYVLTTSKEIAAAIAIISLLIIMKHHANIGRLMKGEEPRIGGGGKKPAPEPKPEERTYDVAEDRDEEAEDSSEP